MKSPKIERAVLVSGFVALAAWFAVFLMGSAVNHDVFHLMALARESLALGYVPHHDLYSYAPTRNPVVHHEWLAGVVALAAYKAAGTNGFALLWFAIAAGCAAFCARVLLRLPPPIAFAAGFISFPLVTYSLIQPMVAQSWSVLLCAVLLLFLQADTDGKRLRLFGFVPVFVLWVNLHGGAVVALGIVAAYAIEQRLRGERYVHAVALFAMLLAAMAVNPYTWGYHQYLVRAITMSRPQIEQWQVGWLFSADNAHYIVPFVLMAAVYVWTVASAGFRFRGALVTAALAAASMRGHKLLPFFAMAWLIYIPAALAATPTGHALQRLWKRMVVVSPVRPSSQSRLFSV